MSQVSERHVQGNIGLQGHQFTANPGLVSELDKVFSPLVLFDLASARQQRIQIAIFVNQKSSRLDADAWNPWHVIHAVTSKGLHINDFVGLDTKFFQAFISPQGLLFHGVP